MKNFFFIFILFLFAGSLKAQTYKQYVKFADKNYAAGDYYGAAIYYKKALDIDSLELEINWKYAECLRMYNDYEQAEYYYSKIFYREQSKVYPLSLFWTATMQKYNGKYKDAGKNFKIVTKQFAKNKKSYEYLKAKQEMKSCSFAMRSLSKDTTGFKIKNSGEIINSYDSEFGARLIDTTINFSSLRADNVKGDFEIHDPNYKIKIYQLQFSNSKYHKPNSIDTLINSVLSNNANGCFNTDKTIFYFTRCDIEGCKIYSSVYRNNSWTQPEELGSGVNKEGHNSTQPMVAKVGEYEYLFFSSNIPGGEGKMDIWYSQIANGKIGKPKNAGKNINSIDEEITPFYDFEENVLYFSSNWHEGFGGFDIFKSTGTLEKLGIPSNLGKPINTQWNDLYFSTYPSEYVAFLTSNRLGSMFKKSPTCCNDIYQIDFPRKIVTVDTIPYKSLVDLNKYLPVTLYFHNDEPNPNNLDTVTKLNYMSTYNAYTSLTDKYKKEYSKGLEGDKAVKAEDDIDNLFLDYVDKGVNDLEIFTKLLLIELEKGQQIELTIKGFASPLAKTDYNVNLTKRRISSLMNYLREYNGGIFIPYIEGTSPNGGKLFFQKIPFGEYSASNLVSDNLQDTKNSVYSRAAALERKIEIQTVQRANKDSIISELRVNKESHDFGSAKSGDILTTTFKISNVGKDDLIINNVLIGCDCILVEYPKEAIKPGESAELKVTFKTEGYTGKNVRSFTLVTNGFPPNKRIVITAELFAK